MLKLKSERKNKGEKGIAIILATMTILILGGLIGLAIDGGIAYFLKARLGQAMDAAALSGARSLARGVDVAAQAASAQTVAQNYFAANFPTNFWGCTVPTPTVAVWEDMVNTHIRYVQVTGSVSTPLYFLRVLGFTTASLSSTATAQRRDVNVVVVLDRSGSMSAAEAQLIADANWFVSQFAAGRDKVGLVTFGGTYYLIKPSTNFTAVPTAISTLTSHTGGTTNHAQPLWTAYKALAEINEPSSLNVIVFFTDGDANTIFANWAPYLKNPGSCNNGLASNPPPVSKPINAMALQYVCCGSPPPAAGLFSTTTAYAPYGPVNSLSPDTAYTDYVTTAYDLNDPLSELTTMVNHGGCNFWGSSGGVTLGTDFTQIPPFDYYGNATNSAGASPAGPPADCPSCTQQYTPVTLTNASDSNQIANAAFNAADNAAQRMRKGVINSIVPMVDCIALNDGYPIADDYMNRLANTPNSAIYNSNYPTGLYKLALSTSDLQPAFQQIASQILHLSQ